MKTEALPNQSGGRPADNPEPGDADECLPTSYGTDRLVLMARDPTCAQAYWEISATRIDEARDSLGGGKAILRLLGVPTGHLVAEHEVCAKHGSYGVALPHPDRAYAAEIAIVRNYRKVVLARSNLVQAPPSTPRPAAAPVFVSREEQRHAFEGGLTLESGGGAPSPLPPFGTREGAATRPSSVGSEARLSSFGSERAATREHTATAAQPAQDQRLSDRRDAG